jgi:hypothetical protein
MSKNEPSGSAGFVRSRLILYRRIFSRTAGRFQGEIVGQCGEFFARGAGRLILGFFVAVRSCDFLSGWGRWLAWRADHAEAEGADDAERGENGDALREVKKVEEECSLH